AQNPQFASQCWRQRILAPCPWRHGQILRRLLGPEVPPALERLCGPAGERHQLRVKHQPGARLAVVAPILDDIDDALAHQHVPVDHPIHRAAVDHLLMPARKRARAMAQRWAGSRALALKLAQMIDIPHANSEFGEMQHCPTTRRSPPMMAGTAVHLNRAQLGRDEPARTQGIRTAYRRTSRHHASDRGHLRSWFTINEYRASARQACRNCGGLWPRKWRSAVAAHSSRNSPAYTHRSRAAGNSPT